MEFDDKCRQIKDIDGHIEAGKQFDLDIVLPEDNRGVLYGIIRDCYKEPIKDAVVKLIEVECECGKEERKPVSHTFTDDDGEFVFGPLCPDKKYDIEIWVNRVKHVKICSKCHREGNCLKGIDMKHCDCFVGKEDEHDECKKDCHCHKEDEHDECKKDCHCHKEDEHDECKKECHCHKEDEHDECKKDCCCEKKEEHNECKKDCCFQKKNCFGK